MSRRFSTQTHGSFELDQFTTSWLLRLGNEDAQPRTGCGADGCVGAELLPTDLYCHDHERLILFGQVLSGTVRKIVVNVLRFALCWTVVLAAQWGSPVPL